MIRRLLERLSRRVVLRRRLPPRFGACDVLVSPSSSLRFWRGSLERSAPELFAWAEKLVRPGDVIWDIGANLGLFGIAASSRAGTGGAVLALEPDAWMADLVRRSVARLPADFAPVEVLRAAAAAEDGASEFILASRGRAANHLASVAGSSQAGTARRRVVVPAVQLDSLLDGRRPPTLVKIDVEGAELMVLRGAKRLLASCRPTLLVEVASTHADAVGELLRAASYRLFDAEKLERPLRELASPTWNTLAVASEREPPA